MKSLGSIFASPLVCLGILGGIVAENQRHARPEDAAAYHAQAKAAIDRWPDKIGDEWISYEGKIPDAAVQLLRPNTVLCRHYVSMSGRSADLLVVQCREPSDMSGHYPPNCYPNNGQPLVSALEHDWNVDGQIIRGMQYVFQESSLGASRRLCVYNFFVLPGHGIVRDMDEVRKATGDYQRRFFGAAQFQLVFSADMPVETRDSIFSAIMGSNPGVFAALNPAL